MKEPKYSKTFFLNTSGISSVEFFWGLGLPLVLESTFLQLFLSKLGASNLVIGLVPTFSFVGQSLLGLGAAFMTRKLEKQRAVVIVFHMVPAVTILLFGIYLLISGTFLPTTIVVFFIVYIIFNAGIGLILPVWQNYLVKLFNHTEVIRALAVMMIVQSAGRLLSSFFIAGFFSDREISAISSASLFILCGMFFFIGAFGFFLTREPVLAADKDSDHSNFVSFLSASFKNIFRNKNILIFLLSDIEMYAVVAVISFYANYAVSLYGVSAAVAAGLFVGLNYAGQITANFIFGTLNMLSMRNKCLAGRLCSISGILLIMFFPETAVFLAASVLMGISRAIRSLIYAPAIRLLSGKNDATSYFAAAPVMLLPLSTGIPLLSGKMLDSLPFSAPAAYKLTFGLLAALSFLSIFLIRRVDFSPRTASAGAAEA